MILKLDMVGSSECLGDYSIPSYTQNPSSSSLADNKVVALVNNSSETLIYYGYLWKEPRKYFDYLPCNILYLISF